MQELSVDVRKQKLAQCQNDQKLTEEQLELTDNRLKGKKAAVIFVYALLLTLRSMPS